MGLSILLLSFCLTLFCGVSYTFRLCSPSHAGLALWRLPVFMAYLFYELCVCMQRFFVYQWYLYQGCAVRHSDGFVPSLIGGVWFSPAGLIFALHWYNCILNDNVYLCTTLILHCKCSTFIFFPQPFYEFFLINYAVWLFLMLFRVYFCFLSHEFTSVLLYLHWLCKINPISFFIYVPRQCTCGLSLPYCRVLIAILKFRNNHYKSPLIFRLFWNWKSVAANKRALDLFG